MKIFTKSLLAHIAFCTFCTTGMPLCAKGRFVMEEIWKPINGYEETHFVSNHGNVMVNERLVIYSNKAKRIYPAKRLNTKPRSGYIFAGLSKNGKRKKFSVHRLVAIAFIPNPLNKPVVNHLDSNPKNNRADNLEWATHQENSIHAAKYGKMNGNNPRMCQKLTPESVMEIRILKNGGISNYRISEIYNVSVTLITAIINGIRWKESSSSVPK